MKQFSIRLLSIICLASASVNVSATSVDVNETVFKHANIVDVLHGVVLHDQDLIVKNGKITAIHASGQSVSTMKVVDLSNQFIIPALIDTHVHLGILNGTSDSDQNNTPENVLRQLKIFARYGVGAVMSLGRDKPFIFQLRADRNQGKFKFVSPYLFTAGQGIGVAAGAPPAMKGGVDPVYRPASIADVRRDLTALAKNHPDIVKIWVDDWLGKYPKMQPAMYKAIIQEAHRLHMRVAAHVYYLQDAKALVEAGVDVLEHDIRDQVITDDILTLMKKHHVTYVPTLTLIEAFYIFKDRPVWMDQEFFKNALDKGVWEKINSAEYVPNDKQRAILETSLQNVKRIYDAGIPVAFGTDAGAIYLRVQGFSEHRELQLLVQAGLTPMEALQTATINSAELLHADKNMGSVSVGKLANFVILEADPMTDIANTQKISAVYIDGKQVN